MGRAVTPVGEQVLVAMAFTGLVGLAFVAVQGIEIPLRLSLSLFVVVVLSALFHLVRAGSFLGAVLLTVYSLPFTTIMPHLWSGNFEWVRPNLHSFAYTTNESLLTHTATIGLVGSLAFTVGAFVSVRRRRSLNRGVSGVVEGRRRLSLPEALGVACVAALAQWLSAPTATILAATYADALVGRLGGQYNFNAGHIVAQVLLIFLALDFVYDKQRARRRGKAWILGASFAIVVVWLQLLRGDREVTGLILAIGLLLFLEREHFSLDAWRASWKRYAVVIAAFLLVLAAGLLTLGAARSSVARGTESSVGSVFQDGLRSPTWNAILLTNVAASEKALDPSEPLLWGETYVDYVLSVVPGPIAAQLNWERPIDSNQGPAWWSKGISLGGVHTVVVPLRNFGVVGVVLWMFALGSLGKHLDALRQRSFLTRYVWLVFVSSSFFWLWYGNMTMIRALTVLGLVYSAYLLVTTPIRSWRP